MSEQLINLIAVIVTQAIGYVALGKKLNAVISDMQLIKKHLGIEIENGKVIELRPVADGAEK